MKSGRFGKTGFRPVELPGLGIVERLVDPVMVVVVHPFVDARLEFDQVTLGSQVKPLAFE